MELKCDTHSELELTQAFRRRALAFDLAGASSYNIMNGYHHYLIQGLQEAPPPGYARISTAQVLRADRAAFTRVAETIKGVRREPDGSLPLDAAIKQIVLDPSVSFHLLPLALDRATSASGAEAGHPKRKFDQTRCGAAARTALRIVFGRVARALGPPRSSLASLGRPPEARGSVGILIWPKAVTSRSLDKPVLKGCTCAPNPAARSRIL